MKNNLEQIFIAGLIAACFTLVIYLTVGIFLAVVDGIAIDTNDIIIQYLFGVMYGVLYYVCWKLDLANHWILVFFDEGKENV